MKSFAHSNLSWLLAQVSLGQLLPVFIFVAAVSYYAELFLALLCLCHSRGRHLISRI